MLLLYILVNFYTGKKNVNEYYNLIVYVQESTRLKIFISKTVKQDNYFDY